ncbi:hypothetical protein FB45DRAFT_894733 [Roridomyces roridus]|uniref:Uncharacterized protein n=1 Tax=Roridomyces roridus TaxID=1738132 RepID=A0AAD7CGC1_9AGAR|nr:hypothetical protein FB45DRAFT_894733 [Roridomyces roridus]
MAASPAMNRKPSKALSSKSSSAACASTPTSVLKPSLSVPNRLWLPRGQRSLQTMSSDSNLRLTDKNLRRMSSMDRVSFRFKLKLQPPPLPTNTNSGPGGGGGVPLRRLTSTGATHGSSSKYRPPPLDLTSTDLDSEVPCSPCQSTPEWPRKIAEYIPELYEDVDPIRFVGKLYTWDEDPSWLDYTSLPPPPRKHTPNVKYGRLATKPKRGPGICSSCSSERGFSCGSARCEPKVEVSAPVAAPSVDAEMTATSAVSHDETSMKTDILSAI